MGYEKVSSVATVKLSGVNKLTGKKNPTTLEGYYVRWEPRPNSFNPDKPQKFYVFLTSEGEVGVYGTAGIDFEMKKCKIGQMTKLVNTGKEKPSKLGQPTKIYEAYQDKANTITQEEIDLLNPESYLPSEEASATSAEQDDEEEDTLEGDTVSLDEITTPPAAFVNARPSTFPHKTAAKSTVTAAQVNSLLKNRTRSSTQA